MNAPEKPHKTNGTPISAARPIALTALASIIGTIFVIMATTADYLLDLAVDYTCFGTTSGAIVRRFKTEEQRAEWEAWCKPLWETD